MNMQTGPAPKQTMRSWLLWTGIMELINVALMYFVWLTFNWALPGTQDLLSILGMLVTVVILTEGGVYWLMARAGFFRHASARVRLRLLQVLYGLNILLLVGYPVALVVKLITSSPVEWADALLGGAFYVFGLGEFLHYFVFKINMRLYEFKQVVRTGRGIPARLRRELCRAQNDIENKIPVS